MGAGLCSPCSGRANRGNAISLKTGLRAEFSADTGSHELVIILEFSNRIYRDGHDSAR